MDFHSKQKSRTKKGKKWGKNLKQKATAEVDRLVDKP